MLTLKAKKAKPKHPAPAMAQAMARALVMDRVGATHQTLVLGQMANHRGPGTPKIHPKKRAQQMIL